MILLVGPSPERSGGIATYLRLLGDALRSRHPDLHWEFFATDKSGPRSAGALPTRIRDGARVAASFRARLAATRPRLVHICCGSGWGFREAALLIRMGQAAGARVVLHLHAAAFREFWERSPLERGFVRSVLASVDAVGVLSRSFGAFYVDCGALPERVHVIKNGVPLPPLALPAPRVVTAADPLRLVLLGSVEARKGIDALLAAAGRVQRVRAGMISVQVVGPMAAPADQAAAWRAAGEAVGVSFPGRVSASEVSDVLRDTDGLLLPSRREGLPFALLEAMAATRPVLAADTGAIGELLADGAGALVGIDDPGGIAAELLRWIDDAEHRLDLAAAGWHRVREGYTVAESLETTRRAWACAGEATVGEGLDAPGMAR